MPQIVADCCRRRCLSTCNVAAAAAAADDKVINGAFVASSKLQQVVASWLSKNLQTNEIFALLVWFSAASRNCKRRRCGSVACNAPPFLPPPRQRQLLVGQSVLARFWGGHHLFGLLHGRDACDVACNAFLMAFGNLSIAGGSVRMKKKKSKQTALLCCLLWLPHAANGERQLTKQLIWLGTFCLPHVLPHAASCCCNLSWCCAKCCQWLRHHLNDE